MFKKEIYTMSIILKFILIAPKSFLSVFFMF
uniref:Uncharacterized protein n=1 Tax=Siphoviridae sp. ctWdm1 TaxID=2827883 RepID=A0A8S5RXQ1_9CAUD|nr:MAG TPA: hypothetical protein [Siphoviridae sp. ctWdm1]